MMGTDGSFFPISFAALSPSISGIAKSRIMRLGLKLHRFLDGRPSTRDGPAHFPPVMGRKQFAQAASHRLVIVGNQYAYRHRCTSPVSSTLQTLVNTVHTVYNPDGKNGSI